jgi:hypothetical protein
MDLLPISTLAQATSFAITAHLRLFREVQYILLTTPWSRVLGKTYEPTWTWLAQIPGWSLKSPPYGIRSSVARLTAVFRVVRSLRLSLQWVCCARIRWQEPEEHDSLRMQAIIPIHREDCSQFIRQGRYPPKLWALHCLDWFRTVSARTNHLLRLVGFRTNSMLGKGNSIIFPCNTCLCNHIMEVRCIGATW